MGNQLQYNADYWKATYPKDQLTERVNKGGKFYFPH